MPQSLKQQVISLFSAVQSTAVLIQSVGSEQKLQTAGFQGTSPRLPRKQGARC